MIKLLTLNLWGFNDWSNRKNNITGILNELQPDIVALQEVRSDDKFFQEPQSSIIAKLCDYKYRIYVPSHKKVITEGVEKRNVDHGLALLSKYSILESEAIFLEKLPEDNEQAIIVLSKIKFKDKSLHICNVHFENNDRAAERQLKQTMNLMHDKGILPIILGDFNIYKLDNYKNILHNYRISTEFTPYVSYPKDNGTLDYIVIPDNGYDFDEVVCLKSYVSDHRAIFGKIVNNDYASS